MVLGPERKITLSQENALLKLLRGIAYGKRAAYSDYEEAVFQSRRPIIFSHARELQVSSEFEAASICVGIDSPAGSARRMEEAVRRNHPEILGSILSAATRVLARGSTDFLTAAEEVGDYFRWPPGYISQLIAGEPCGVTNRITRSVSVCLPPARSSSAGSHGNETAEHAQRQRDGG